MYKTLLIKTEADVEIINIDQIVSVFWNRENKTLTLHLASSGSRQYKDMPTIRKVLREFRQWGLHEVRELEKEIE